MSEYGSSLERYAKASCLAGSVSFMGVYGAVLKWSCHSSNANIGSYIVSRIPNLDAIGQCDWHCTCKDFDIQSKEHISYQCKHIVAVGLFIVNRNISALLKKQLPPLAMPPEWIVLPNASGSLSLAFDNNLNSECDIVSRLQQIANNKTTSTINVSMTLRGFCSVHHSLTDTPSGVSHEEIALGFTVSEIHVSEVFIG